MLSPYIHAALARERHQEFLARAETDRRARQARLHRPRDGTGAARDELDADGPQAAEIADTIIDDWQGREPGTELAQLCR